MKRFLIICCFLGFFLTMQSGPAASQGDPRRAQSEKEKAERSALANKIFEQLPLEDRQRLLNESEAVYQYCSGRELFASLHDCRCVGSMFFEERIFRPDPKLNIIGIGDRVAKDCPNIPGVAGYAYNQCVTSMSHKIRIGSEDFCTCYANSYAKFYEGNTRAAFSNLTKIGTAAILECDRQGLPSPLNPDRL